MTDAYRLRTLHFKFTEEFRTLQEIEARLTHTVATESPRHTSIPRIREERGVQALVVAHVANEFMRTHGNAWVADHNAIIIGQGTFNFAQEKARRRPPASEKPDAPL